MDARSTLFVLAAAALTASGCGAILDFRNGDYDLVEGGADADAAHLLTSDAGDGMTGPSVEAPQALAQVTVSGSGSCMGVPLTSGWVLLAGHCLTKLSGASPSLHVDGVASDDEIAAQILLTDGGTTSWIAVDHHYFFGASRATRRSRRVELWGRGGKAPISQWCTSSPWVVRPTTRSLLAALRRSSARCSTILG